MTIHVPIAEFHARIDELLAAARRGEDVVVEEAGIPQVRLTAVDRTVDEAAIAIARRRERALGMFAAEFEGYDTSIEALKSHRGDPEERFRRKFGPPD